jgi:hypothetical protein
MQLQNCRECGKVMQHGGMRQLCHDCAEKREQEFLRVRDFIKSNPKVAVEVVCEAADVLEKRVREFIREGLIEASELDGFPVECQKCGKPIARGVYCPLCQQDISSDFGRINQHLQKSTAKAKDTKRSSLTLQYRKKR